VIAWRRLRVTVIALSAVGLRVFFRRFVKNVSGGKLKLTKYFISGGAGFIGGHLVDRLVANGSSVTVYDNLSSGKKSIFNTISVR